MNPPYNKEILLKVDDEVTVRSWDSMMREFGHTGIGINAPLYFAADMGKFCGLTARIIDIDYSKMGGCQRYVLDFGHHMGDTGCEFSGPMLEEFVALYDKTKLRDKLMKGEFNADLI